MLGVVLVASGSELMLDRNQRPRGSDDVWLALPSFRDGLQGRAEPAPRNDDGPFSLPNEKQCRSMSRAAGAEDCGADTDVGGAEADCLLEIGAHAHAEHTQVVAAGNFAQ